MKCSNPVFWLIKRLDATKGQPNTTHSISTRLKPFSFLGLFSALSRMDASDIIRKLQSRAVFSNRKQVQQVIQPACNLSTCCGTAGCTLNFLDYQQRYLFYEGQKYCSTCVSNYPINNRNDVCGCS